MSLQNIEENIVRLIIARRTADETTQKRINAQLNGLYNFKYELLKGDK